jgi:hypothetical protein
LAIRERAPTSPDQVATPLRFAKVRRVTFGIVPSMVLAALDQSLAATALPNIGRYLHDAVILIPKMMPPCCAICRTACIEI